MDIQAYTELKEKNAATIVKDKDVLFVSYTRYDVSTGEKLVDQKQHINRSELESRRDELKAELDAVESLLREIEALAKEG